MMNPLRSEKAFASLIGLLLAIAIIVFVAYKVYGVYLGKPTVQDKQTRKALSEQGLDTSSAVGTYQSTKGRVGDIKKMIADQSDQLPPEMK